jgi:hypothetical protein
MVDTTCCEPFGRAVGPRNLQPLYEVAFTLDPVDPGVTYQPPAGLLKASRHRLPHLARPEFGIQEVLDQRGLLGLPLGPERLARGVRQHLVE